MKRKPKPAARAKIAKAPRLGEAEITHLHEAILSMTTLTELRLFLRDLLTESEIQELTERWKVARMLNDGFSYTRIIEDTGLSSTTVARVAGWLKQGAGGYRLALARLASLPDLQPSPSNLQPSPHDAAREEVPQGPHVASVGGVLSKRM